jgi:UMF1 family MFS transporter
MCVATALLWTVTPEPASALPCLVLVAISTICFEVATVFYNALLPVVAPPEKIGRVSGWAWGVGYAGGLVCLVIVLFGLVKASPPPFGLSPAQAEPVRASAPFLAVWMAVFTLPLLLWVRDPAPEGTGGLWFAARRAAGDLAAAVRAWPREARIGRFLIARMLYTDGLNTLFAFGGIYAAGSFGMPLSEVIAFGIALNVTAGLGAAAFGWLDDVMGPKRVILISLAAIFVLGTVLVFAADPRWFWGLGLALGIFVGPAQAASRTFLARIAPREEIGACFGLYALSGKVTAFLGPAVLAAATAAADSQRVGMATILAFLLAGGVLLTAVPKTRPGSVA